MGFLDKFKLSRLKEGLAKTRDNVIEKVTRVISAHRKIDDDLLDEITVVDDDHVLIGDAELTRVGTTDTWTFGAVIET